MQSILKNHLGWRTQKRQFESKFVSITSSLLFAIQLALQKYARYQKDKERRKNNVRPGDPPACSIFISILDLNTLPNDALLFKAEHLLDGYEYGFDLVDHREWLVAEYLVYQELVVESCHIPFESLINDGFFSLFHSFKQNSVGLQNLVQAQRKRLFSWNSMLDKTRTSFPLHRYEIAVRMAQQFGQNFQLPILVAFLSLSRRWHKDESIVESLMETIDGEIAAIYLNGLADIYRWACELAAIS